MSRSPLGTRVWFPALLAAAALLAGCAGLPVPSPEGGPPPTPKETREVKKTADPFADLAERYERKAREAEAAGNDRKALEAWRIAASLRPGDADTRREADRLAQSLTVSADTHYHRGLSLLENEFLSGARKEFLLALADRPGHAGALDALKNRLEEDTFLYRVGEGDTFEGIADRVYGDPGLAFLVARLNNLDPDSTPLPGRDLDLPLLEGEAARKPPPPPMPAVPAAPPKAEKKAGENSVAMRLAKAEGYLEAGSYQDALAAAAGIPDGAPQAEAAREIINAAHYRAGVRQEEEGDYAAALASYQKVNPGYQDVKKRLSSARKIVAELAEEHYKAGVQYFVNQKLEQAVTEWEKTLELNPEHPNADKDLIKARKLIEELQKIQ